MDDAADVHDHLVLSGHARNRGRLARAFFVFRQVDSRVDHLHSVFRHAFLFDHDFLDRLARCDHRGGVAKNLSLQCLHCPERQSAAQPVSPDVVAQQRVDLVDHRPPIAPAGKRRPRRAAKVLGVNQLERMFAGDLIQPGPGEPGGGRNGVDRRILELASLNVDTPGRSQAKMGHDDVDARGV